MDGLTQSTNSIADSIHFYMFSDLSKSYRELTKARIVKDVRKLILDLRQQNLTTEQQRSFVVINFVQLKLMIAFLRSHPSNERFSFPFMNINGVNIYGLGVSLSNLLRFRQYTESISVSDIFNEFVRGITYFQGHTNVHHPVYHRNQSCGPRADIQTFIDQHLDCSLISATTNNAASNAAYNTEYERRRKNIFNCYLERVIYDTLYSRYVGRQDDPHEQQAYNRMQQLYRNCYGLSANLTIRISYDQNMPNEIEINYTTPELERVESYSKDIVAYNPLSYNPNVFCMRFSIDIKNKVEISSTKTQTFVGGEVEWTDNLFMQTGGDGETKRYKYVDGRKYRLREDVFGQSYIIKNKQKVYI